MKLLFASGSAAVNQRVLEEYRRIYPELPLLLVAEFAPGGLYKNETWVRYHLHRSREENEALVRAALAGRPIRLSAIILEPRIPHWPMRRLGFGIAPWQAVIFNETGTHFMLRPRSLPAMAKHVLWRLRNLVRSEMAPKGRIGKLLKIARNPSELRLPWLYRAALRNGAKLAAERPQAQVAALEANDRPRGISVVIPSRNGRDLLETCLPPIAADASEIIVIDNGSDDGTVEWLAREYPEVVVEHSPEPLAFAVAVNRGIRQARYSHVCLLNNDMVCEPGFLAALERPFAEIPDLFATSAQIFFPEGQRREETGKTVINLSPAPDEFPIRCDVPLQGKDDDGEDQTWVLYGSGGCSLYDAAKLAALGGFDEAYVPAYVEDLDLGVRGWLRGWPTVYCAGAKVLHQHRATTSRYLSEAELDLALERNFVQFLARAIPDPAVFDRMWRQNALRLKVQEKAEALEVAARQPLCPSRLGKWDFWI